jgi:ribonuclease HI
MSAGHHEDVLRRLAAAARAGAMPSLPEGVSPHEAAAALEAGAAALAVHARRPAAGARPLGGRVPPAEGSAGRLVRIHVDGAARGNPGPAGFGAVLEGVPDGARETHWEYLGEATNNVAEYQALLWALAEAQRRGFEGAEVWSDSELMVKQMRGEYRVKHPRLQPLHARAAALARGFRRFSIRAVPRGQNAEADALANRAIDEAQGASRARGPARGGGD